MRADDIQPGDTLLDREGATVYTVLEVDHEPPFVVATVQHADGGTSRRLWEQGKQTPLTR